MNMSRKQLTKSDSRNRSSIYMDESRKKELTNFLSQFVTESKKCRIEEVLANRTCHLTVVLEDIFQPHNASAVLRSCECFGLQNVHIIENRFEYRVNPDVTLGSTKWLHLHRYREEGVNNTLACINKLKSQGYRIAATTLGNESIALNDLPVDQKIALCFGTEEDGLTEEAIALSEYRVKIPMWGFTQSFNISVSAALCLFDLTTRMRSSGIDWSLTEQEKEDLRILWYQKSIRNAELVTKNFLENKVG